VISDLALHPRVAPWRRTVTIINTLKLIHCSKKVSASGVDARVSLVAALANGCSNVLVVQMRAATTLAEDIASVDGRVHEM